MDTTYEGLSKKNSNYRPATNFPLGSLKPGEGFVSAPAIHSNYEPSILRVCDTSLLIAEITCAYTPIGLS